MKTKLIFAFVLAIAMQMMASAAEPVLVVGMADKTESVFSLSTVKNVVLDAPNLTVCTDSQTSFTLNNVKFLVFEERTSTDAEMVQQANPKRTKVVRDGRIIIQSEQGDYTVLGTKIQ